MSNIYVEVFKSNANGIIIIDNSKTGGVSGEIEYINDRVVKTFKQESKTIYEWMYQSKNGYSKSLKSKYNTNEKISKRKRKTKKNT